MSRVGTATRHWRNQRLSAIALVPLGLWFVFALARQPDLDHATIAAWLGKPLQALLAALFGAAMLWHSMLGIEVVLEDYVHGRVLKPSLLIARIVHVVAAVVLVCAVAGIAGYFR